MDGPHDALARLHAALDDIASVPLSCWNRDDLADWLCGLQAARARFDATLCTAAATADSAGVATLDGARTLRRFVAGRSATNPADVASDLRLAQWLERFPVLAAALRDGRLTRRHADAVRELDNPRTHTLLRDAQSLLAEAGELAVGPDGTPIHPKMVTGLLGVATLRRLVLGANSEILDLGRSVRNFPRHLKDALLAAHRGRCSTPHCDALLVWLQADHILPWSRGGPTATHNGQPLCGADNRAKSDHHPPRAATTPHAA